MPPAATVAGVQRELDTGMFGSSQSDPNGVLGGYHPNGLVGCSAHPVVLLFGLLDHRGESVALRSHGVEVRLKRTRVSSGLGVRADVLYGAITSADEALIERSANGATIESSQLPGPPRRRARVGGTDGVMYAFPVGH